MDYAKVHDSLVSRAKERSLTGYHELHHIVPRCLGGSNNKSNLVVLTAREHYIIHLLLVKMYPTNRSLWYAANMMANRNGRTYEWVKKQHAINVAIDHTGMKHTAEAKRKMSLAIAARPREEFIEEQRRRATNPKKKRDGYFKPKSAEHAQNISKAALTRIRVSCAICGKLVTTANIKNHQKVHTNDSI